MWYNDNNDEWILSAKKSFEAISDLILDNGFLSARIDNAANPLSDYVCLVGNCQMSIIDVNYTKFLVLKFFRQISNFA